MTPEEPDSRPAPDVADRLGLDLTDADWIEHVRGAFRETPPPRLGRFEILEQTRAGGQGIVYRARDPVDRRIVALKRLARGTLASPREHFRFERELEAAQSLDHPHIVRVLGMELIDGQPLIEMEWVEGVTVDRWARSLPRGTAASRSAILNVFLDICDAVHHAHQRGVIHRDLKPANLLVMVAGDEAEPAGLHPADASPPHRVAADMSPGVMAKVIDFGVAKLSLADGTATGLTGSQDFLGTPAYAAPEQIAGENQAVDVRTDVYSLGVVLYELLTGTLPFDTSTGVARLFDAIRMGDVPPPSRNAVSLDRDIDAVVLKAMACDPQRRYPSVEALAADLRRYQAGEPLEARRGQRWYALRKLLRKHHGAAAAVGAIVTVLATSAVVFFLLYSKQTRATAAMTLARNDEAAARREAQQILTALSEFLLSVAEAGRGTDAAVRRSLIEDAERRIEPDLVDSPAAMATACDAVGRTYQAMGLYAEAQRALCSALELRTRVLGRRHADTAISIRNLARLFQDCSRVADAEPLFCEAADIRHELFGRNHPAAADGLHDLGIVASNRQDFASARDFFAEAATLRLRLLGPTHPDTLDAREALAYALANLSDYDSAALELQAVLTLTEATFGPEHRRTAGLHVGIGKVLAELGALDEAELHLRCGLTGFRNLLGDRHDNVAWAAHRLANVLHRRGANEEAEALLLEARDTYRRVLGPDDPFVGFVCESLAAFFDDTGQSEKAALSRLEFDRIRGLGTDSP